ncbi:MAG TPA: secretin N-terminal domain-containing protein [Chthoniobacterales bacterium]|nr:secretin N-terminal domain-containing protein [Chthoniobacterales bacterium]
MKTLWLLPLGLVLSCWYCGTAWAQNKIEVNDGQTKIESDQADPPDPPPANATPNRKIIDPGTPGDPGSETSTFSAVNNNITTILQDYQELTGKTVIEDSNLSANAVPITILVPNPVPREQLVRLIEAALLLNNYAFVPGPSETTVKVINLNTGKNPRSEGVRLYTTPDSLPEGEQIVSYYMPLNYISAQEALAVFQTHVLPRAYTAFVPVNSAQAVVITENTSVIKELIALKQLIDVPPAATSTEFVQLIRADAERVTDTLNKLLEGGQKGTGGTQTPGAPGNVQINYAAGSSGIAGLQAQLVADARTNRILVVSRPQNMAQLRSLILSFDQANLAEKPLEYKLRYVSAGDVLPVLKDLLTETPEQGGQGGTSGTTGGQQQQQPSQQRAVSSSTPSSPSTYTGGYSQTNATGGGQQQGQDLLQDPNEELGPQSIVVGKTRVISDAKDNKVIVIGPPESIQKVRMLLERLDQRPQQVYLATVIGNLTLNGETDLGVDWAQTFKKIAGQQSGVASANLNSNVNGQSIIGTGTGGTGVVNPGAILSGALIPGLQGLAIYGKIGDALSVFIRALDTRSHFTILARPAVYTANNKRAVISNGQQVPIPGTSLSNVPTTTTGTAAGSVASVESTVQYEDVELRLEVIPLINSNNEVTLKIAQINNTLGSNVNISGNEVPIINSQRLTTTVTIPSGATVVLGGLIQDEIQKTDNGIPYVDNIPYLGHLFKYTTRIKNRTELLIFIQPTIVDNNIDAYRASLKEEKRSVVGSEMSDLAHPNDYANPGPTGKRLKNQK